MKTSANATDIITSRDENYHEMFFFNERANFTHVQFQMNYQQRRRYANSSRILLEEKCYNVISHCPKWSSPTSPLHKMCNTLTSNDILSNIPISTAKTIYKNMYCALCHGLDLVKDEYAPWNVEYLCDENPGINETEIIPDSNITELYRCKYVHTVPSSDLVLKDFKCRRYVETCPPTYDRDSKIAIACRRYMSNIYLRTSRFKNYHCADCHGLDQTKLRCGGRFVITQPKIFDSEGFKVSFPDFSKLVAFLKAPTNRLNLKPFVTVDCDAVASTKHDMCHKEENDVTILPQLLKGNESFFDITLETHFESHSSVGDFQNRVVGGMNARFSVDIRRKACTRVRHTRCLTSNTFNKSHLKHLCFSLKATGEENIGLESVIGTLTNAIKTFCLNSNCTNMFKFRIYNYMQSHISNRCDIGSQITVNVSEGIGSVLQNGQINSVTSDQVYSLANIPVIYEGGVENIEKDTVEHGNIWATLCQYILGNCTKYVIPESQYKVSDNGSVEIPQYNLIVPRERFDYVNNGIAICSSEIQHLKSTAHYKAPIKNIMSSICLSISLLSLLCTFSVYCMFPSLRTVAGNSLMSLVLALFFGQLVFELSVLPIGYEIPCLIAAVIQHYCYLVTFSWMSILAYDIYSTFTSSTMPAAGNRKTKTFRRYSLFAWFVPLLVILICLLLQFFYDDELGYGAQYFCWLKGPESILYFFAIPLCVSMVLNISFFVRTAIAIHNTATDIQSARKTDSSFELVVMMKMASLMGFTWIFSLLSGWLMIEVFDYLFILFNGLQGFYIFLAFVAKRSTVDLFKRKFGERVDSFVDTKSTKF